MAGKSLWKLCVILFGFVNLSQLSVAQDTARVILPIGDHPEQWILHKNIIGFVSEPGLLPFELTGNISKIEHAAGKLVAIQFNPNATQKEKMAYAENLKQHGIQKRLMAMSKSVESASPIHDKLLFIDDQILITFRETPSNSYLETLSEKYDLELIESETNSQYTSTVKAFRYKSFTENDNSATVSNKIFEREKLKISSVHPNRVNLFEPQSTNDTYVDLAWHIENNGQSLSCSNIQGQHQADAHVTGAWNMGYTGQGIKVGVIDFYGFDYNHPDMQGQILPGWDCINSTDYNASNFHFTDTEQSHGMAVCGVIGANGNNGVGSAGVAYGAKVVPFLIDGSEVSVVLAMQKARSAQFDVDIVNCSFGSYFPSPAIQAEIKNLTEHGRVRNGNPLGVVVVASHGNDNYRDIEHPQYPAAYDEVISVGSSTPDDLKKEPSDSWNTASAWGSNYGALLNLTAPGVCIFTTDLSGTNGYATGDYVAFQKTSASAPIVSGVAALVLSKYPELTWEQLRGRLHEAADKTNNSAEGGGYNYHYDPTKPGRSMEMGYGRVNAEKALSDGAVGINDNTAGNQPPVTMNTLVTGSIEIRSTLDNFEQAEMTIHDMSGRMLLRIPVSAGEGVLTVDASALPSGMYFARCVRSGELILNQKFVRMK